MRKNSFTLKEQNAAGCGFGAGCHRWFAVTGTGYGSAKDGHSLSTAAPTRYLAKLADEKSAERLADRQPWKHASLRCLEREIAIPSCTLLVALLRGAAKISGRLEIAKRARKARDDMNQKKYQELLKGNASLLRDGYEHCEREPDGTRLLLRARRARRRLAGQECKKHWR